MSNQIRKPKKPAPIIETYSHICKDTNWQFKIEISSPFSTIPFCLFYSKVHTQLSHLNKNSILQSIIVSNFKDTINSDFRDFNLVFTDVSKNMHGTSCEFCSKAIKRLYNLSKEASIFTSEIVAIKEAIYKINNLY